MKCPVTLLLLCVYASGDRFYEILICQAKIYFLSVLKKIFNLYLLNDMVVVFL